MFFQKSIKHHYLKGIVFLTTFEWQKRKNKEKEAINIQQTICANTELESKTQEERKIVIITLPSMSHNKRSIR